MDRERDYYAERRDRDRQSTRTLEVWKEGRLLEELDLTACRRYTVGRTEGSDVWTEHESCSRTHAEFRVEAGGVFLVDLDSAAGTCVGAARLTPHEPRRLHDLAKVTFGTSTRSYLLKLDGEIEPPAVGKGGGARPAGSGKGAAAAATVGEKRKLLWGNKRALAQGVAQGGVSLAQQRAPEAGVSGWASAASALGDSDRQAKFMSLLGANKHGGSGGRTGGGSGGGAAPGSGGGGGGSGGGGGGGGDGGGSSAHPAPPPPPSSAGWQELLDEHGNAYYYHPESGVTQWERPGSGPASQWQPAEAVTQAGASAGGEAGGEAGGGGERQQQEQLFNTLEAQFERSRRMQYGRGSRGGF